MSDGSQVSTDPPVRERPGAPVEPAVDFEPAPEVEPEVDHEAEPQSAIETMMSSNPMGKERLPPSERASTAPVSGSFLAGRSKLLVPFAGAAVVLAALIWGWHNYSSANEWRNRSHALDAEIETRISNFDALERSLSNAASRGARAADSQQVMVQLQDATNETIDQINQCASALNSFINAYSGGDPTSAAAQANQVCQNAAVNAQVLNALLEELTGS